MTYSRNISIAAIIASSVQAGIKQDGLWTNQDWYNHQHKVGVANGIPYSDDTATNRAITAPMALAGPVTDYLQKSNVQRVQSILSEAEWDFLFPLKNDVYAYDGFLNAVGKFPAFCSENADAVHWSGIDMCKKELATMFAHFALETSYNSQWEADNGSQTPLWRQGLHFIENVDCTGGNLSNAGCDYHDFGWSDDYWPNQTDKQYYARGPFQLAWNYNYGRFSNIFNEGAYDSKMALLENPDLVHQDAFTVFSSALWFYMTPQSPKPSMHDVVTGYFQPNAADIAAGITGGFGTTTNIINGGDECGWDSPHATKRGDFYEEFLNYFGITDTHGSLDCDNETPGFPQGSAGAMPSYFTWDWTWGNDQKCQIVTWQTPFSIYAKDDYKRCICDQVGNGANDCQQA